MKLDNLTNRETKVNRFNRIFESRFGKTVDFDTLTPTVAIKMVKKLDETLQAYRMSPAYHTSHKNPKYMEALILKEGLDDWLHVKLNIAHKRPLTEGEIEQAEAVLAAKDFVDRLQKMLEDVGRIINEDLPPLTDVIRDQMGQEQAEAYSSTATQALSDIQTAISTGRGALDSAARVLAGEQQPQTDMAMPAGDEMGDAVGPEVAPEAQPEMPPEEGEGDLEANFDGGADIGREMR